mgnify:FL=1
MSHYEDWMVEEIQAVRLKIGNDFFTWRDVALAVQSRPVYSTQYQALVGSAVPQADRLDRELARAIPYVYSKQKHYLYGKDNNGKPRSLSLPMYPGFRYAGNWYRRNMFALTREEALLVADSKAANRRRVDLQDSFWRYITDSLKGRQRVGDLNLTALWEKFLG